ncbi:hypothetical protein ARMGADRAFT_1035552 [Armillaria gallica]|uniref:Uncharacterized protein n=1 Tax=Armillaria gallica TaxID=47427 RepID=A0A2H3DDN8_ARMGA|nr:hypothetical protein ARMGADRAFT_1035552 [Armillaria gallica]
MNGNWPLFPYWMTGTSGRMPLNQAGPPASYGAYPPSASPNAQTANIGWPNPYMYALFGQPSPFNFLQPPPMLYGGFAPTQHVGQPTGAKATPHTGTALMQQHATPMAGPSREQDAPTEPRAWIAHNDNEAEEEEYYCGKRKQRVSTHDLEQQQLAEDHRCQCEEDRNIDCARQRAETAPIPKQILELQAQELADMHGSPDNAMTGALRDQLSMNQDLMHQCKELKKLLHKHQPSPEWEYQHSHKQYCNLCPYYGRGGFTTPRAREGPGFLRTRDSPSGRPMKQLADVVTAWPKRHQCLVDEDAHDEVLDLYDQRRFTGRVIDCHMTIEELIADLSHELPMMPLPNSSYLKHAIENQPMADVIEVKNSAVPSGMEWDNSFRGMYRPGFLYNPCTNIMYMDCEAVDATKALEEGMAVPIPPDMANRPNPRGFPMNVHKVQESVMFIHMHCPGWQAILWLLWEFQCIATSMIGWYCDLSMHEVMEIFKKDDQLHVLAQGLLHLYFIPIHPCFLRTGPGSIANGAGLPMPVNGSLDDWCWYTTHHFQPNGPNPTSGILMDASYCVSYASIWGMLLMQFLHPTTAKKYYTRHFMGIMFRP